MTDKTNQPAAPELQNENEDGSAVFAVDTTANEQPEERTARADVAEARAAEEQSEAAELANAGTDEEREAIRARRRQERAEKRQKRRERDDMLQAELAQRDQIITQMAQQLNLLTRRSAGTELAQMDNEISSVANAITELKDIIRQATEEQQGDIVAEATERMMKLMSRQENLSNMRAAYIENARRGQSETAPVNPLERARPQLPPPQMRKLGAEWMRENAWFDPQGRDLDSQLARQIDSSVMADGFDPTTPEYWEELSDRVRKYLPHVSADVAQRGGSGQNASGTAQRQVNRSIVSGSGKQGSSSGRPGTKTVTVSPQRVQALKDAGVWDDPVKRADAIRRFQEYDARMASN